jgi:DNA repair protein RAD51
LTTITTGSETIDGLLGGGIRTGLVTNIVSDSRDARSGLCYSLCVNAAEQHKDSSIIFGDTQGFFRPEKILSFIKKKQETDSILHKIRSIRLMSTNVQMVLVNYALHLHPVLIIIDNFSYLFLNEKKKSLSIQFRLRKHLHDLAIYALENDVAVVITNSISSKRENKRSEDVFEKRIISFNELLNNIISNLAHVSLELKDVKTNEPRYSAGLLKPVTSTKSYFIVRPDGLHDR